MQLAHPTFRPGDKVQYAGRIARTVQGRNGTQALLATGFVGTVVDGPHIRPNGRLLYPVQFQGTGLQHVQARYLVHGA